MIRVVKFKKDINQIVESLPEVEIQHMCRVSSLVALLTERLYYPECVGECKYYGQAAFYHDIGKAWVPEEILTKPDKLTEKERKIMCQHPSFARKFFEETKNGLTAGLPKHLIQLAIQAAVHHHEYWDGTGYPYGIKQTDIPLIARITSICDAYDAMTSDRVYRKAQTHAYACGQLETNAGIQFDAELVRIFLNNESEFTDVSQTK